MSAGIAVRVAELGSHAESGDLILPAAHPKARHLAASRQGWDGKPVVLIPCGTPLPYDPERWTRAWRTVTCDACRMTDAFRAARGRR